MSSPEILADNAEALIAEEAENFQEGAIDVSEYAARLHRITTALLFDLLEIGSTRKEQNDGLLLVH
jgi:hypothetical protein